MPEDKTEIYKGLQLRLIHHDERVLSKDGKTSEPRDRTEVLITKDGRYLGNATTLDIAKQLIDQGTIQP